MFLKSRTSFFVMLLDRLGFAHALIEHSNGVGVFIVRRGSEAFRFPAVIHSNFTEVFGTVRS